MLNLRNEFIMAPIKLGYSDGTGIVTEKHIKFYSRRADYIGAITTEPLFLDKGLRELPTQLGIDNDAKIDSLKKIVEVAHNKGAKIIAHINHPGRMANPKIPGNYFVSSTDKACENGGAKPVSMNKDQMEKAKNLIVNAAIRAQKSGFDFVELQYGHGYLMAQFLSPKVNDRTDEYGGSFENRLKFPLEVFDAVKNAIALPIIIRISADEVVKDGLTIEDTIRIIKKLEKKGVAAFHIVAGSGCWTPPWFFQHMFIPKGRLWEKANKIKQAITTPVIFVGQVSSIEDVNLLKEKYNAQYIALGREMVADPDFVGKYLNKIDGIIRPCLRCSDGCLGGVKAGKGLGCVVNPTVAENEDKIKKSDKPKKIAIVGGGLAGMEAASILKQKGHKITLFEKEHLCGQFSLAYLPPNKDSLKDLCEYYSKLLDYLKIQINNKEVKAEDLLNNGYDTVIVATGSTPFVPPIEGLNKYWWAEVLEKDNIFENKKVVIIGGGLIGIETAHGLLEKGNEVIIVEMLDDIANGMEAIEKAMTLASFKDKNITIYTGSKVSKIDGDKVIVTKNNETITINNVDEIVVATGMRSNVQLYEELKDRIEVYKIGDANKVGKAQDAIKDSRLTALQI